MCEISCALFTNSVVIQWWPVVAWQLLTRVSETREIFGGKFHHSISVFTENVSENYFVKSAVRFSQLISQKNVWGINCEIQGVSTVLSAGERLQHLSG